MIKIFALLGAISVILIGVACRPSAMDSPPPSAATVRAELVEFRALRLERAARGLPTKNYDDQIALRERQLCALEALQATAP
jgi:hypothetical protein